MENKSAKSLPVRRSQRNNKGRPPSRYGYEKSDFDNVRRNENEQGVFIRSEKEMDETSQNKSVTTRKSSKVSSSKSQRCQLLEIELERERKLAEIEKKLLDKETEFKMAQLKYGNSSHLSYDEEIKSVVSKSSFVEKWVNTYDPNPEYKYVVNSQEPKYSNNPENMAEELTIKQFMARQSFSKELPVFSGEPGEWMNFIHQFRETTKICGFSTAENMVRLQKSLKGKAKEFVSALLTFTQEVDRIIETLEMRYGRPEVIIQDLIDSVRKIPDMKEEKLDTVLDFSNKVQNLTVTIQSLNCEEYSSNPQLLCDVVRKLSPNLKLEWGRKVVELKKELKKVSIMEFSQWLAETSEAVMYVVPEHDQEKRKKYVCSTSIQQEKTVYKCKYCKKDGHKVEKCNSFRKIEIDNRWNWARENKVCFTCLSSSHHTKFCKSKKKCDVNGCLFKHNPLLHKEPERNSYLEERVNHHIKGREKNEVLLRIAPVELTGPKGKVLTYALFDEASTITMIDAKLADEIGATGPCEALKIKWTNSMTSEETDSKRVNMQIRGKNEETNYLLNNVRTVKNLCLPVQSVDMKSMSQKFRYLQNWKLSSLVNAQPRILIGQDNIDLIIAREVHEGGKNDPVLSKSKLGWVLHGNIGKNYLGRVDEEFSFFVMHQYEELEELVKNSFKIDCLGVKYYNKEQNPDVLRAEAILEKTTRRIGPNKWETGLLWKNDDVELPNNKFTALTRLKSIERKMVINEAFGIEYEKKIEEYVEKGYARKLSYSEVQQRSGRRWFLPHFAVTNKNKPGKIRFVFDAAAKTNGVSLNDVLLKGPDLLNSLLGVIFKFRQRNIAVTADIQEMFHRVFIRPEDRNAQLFLWKGRGTYERNPDVYEMVAMIFGAVSSPTSAQFVMRKNAAEFKQSYPKAFKAITERHYVDDYLDSFDTIEEAKEVTSDVIEVQRRGGFTIRNWASNSKEVLRNIPEEYRSNHQ
ncbi:uncharacterized protein LOC123311734 [Coccinella septempunctata]|uniref:uncharacterized protein LOC123311734 n=1 Tax=Coccinella septempunctata TaxID=41139 RepID=UPI001D07626F|nr:uncharacterized protein LOC123311734 [Coccinella septempunctata]